MGVAYIIITMFLYSEHHQLLESAVSGIFKGGIGPFPLWRQKIFAMVKIYRKTIMVWPPCVSTSGQQKFAPL